MKKKLRIAAFAVSFAAAAGSALWVLKKREQQTRLRPVRVACVGDSITFGHGTEPRERKCYPHLLQQRLGKGWEVKNFGVSGSIIQFSGDLPYAATDALFDSLDYEPDVLVFMLGTNDSKSHNWTSPEILRTDYVQLLDGYRERNPGIQIVLCTCAAVFENGFDIHENRVTEVNGIVRTIAEERGYPLVEVHALTLPNPQWFPDGVHPNNDGAAAIAEEVARTLLGKA